MIGKEITKFTFSGKNVSTSGFGFLDTEKIVVRSNEFEITGTMITGRWKIFGKAIRIISLLLIFILVVSSCSAIAVFGSLWIYSDQSEKEVSTIAVLIGLGVGVLVFALLHDRLKSPMQSVQTIIIKNEDIIIKERYVSVEDTTIFKLNVKNEYYKKGKIYIHKFRQDFEDYLEDIIG